MDPFESVVLFSLPLFSVLILLGVFFLICFLLRCFFVLFCFLSDLFGNSLFGMPSSKCLFSSVTSPGWLPLWCLNKSKLSFFFFFFFFQSDVFWVSFSVVSYSAMLSSGLSLSCLLELLWVFACVCCHWVLSSGAFLFCVWLLISVWELIILMWCLPVMCPHLCASFCFVFWFLAKHISVVLLFIIIHPTIAHIHQSTTF